MESFDLHVNSQEGFMCYRAERSTCGSAGKPLDPCTPCIPGYFRSRLRISREPATFLANTSIHLTQLNTARQTDVDRILT